MKPKVRCVECGGLKHHASHSGGTWTHDFVDGRRKGLHAQSETRRTYLESPEHIEAYAKAESDLCAAEAAGAAGRCILPLTPHHIMPKGIAGGQKAAEKYPIVTLCAYHNDWVQEAGRRWAQTHYFHRDGKNWPFLMTAKGLVQDL